MSSVFCGASILPFLLGLSVRPFKFVVISSSELFVRVGALLTINCHGQPPFLQMTGGLFRAEDLSELGRTSGLWVTLATGSAASV